MTVFAVQADLSNVLMQEHVMLKLGCYTIMYHPIFQRQVSLRLRTLRDKIWHETTNTKVHTDDKQP